MKKILAVLLLLPAFAAANSPLSPADPERGLRLPISDAPPAPVAANQRAQLANGIRIAWADAARAAIPGTGMVQFTITLPYAGDARDPQDKLGLADILAAMLTKAPQSEQLADMAARYSVGAGAEGLTIGVRVASEKLDEAMAHVAAVLLSPTLDPNEFAQARQQAAAGIRMSQNDPKAAADRQMRGVLFPNHFYGQTATIQTVQNVQLADVQALVARSFRPEGVRVVGAGHDVDARQFEQIVERHLAGWRAQPGAALPPALARVVPNAPLSQMRMRIVDIPGSTQSAIRAGHQLVTRDNPDYDVLSLLTYILMRGPQNRMDDELRERMSITYGAHGDFSATSLGGSYIISTEVKRASTTIAMVTIRQQIDRIQTELMNEEDLARAKRMMIQIAGMRLGEVARLAETAAGIESQNLPADQVMRGREAVMAVTAEQLRDAARRYLGADKLDVVIAGDAAIILAGEKGEPGLESVFGPIPVYDTAGNLKPRQAPGAGR